MKYSNSKKLKYVSCHPADPTVFQKIFSAFLTDIQKEEKIQKQKRTEVPAIIIDAVYEDKSKRRIHVTKRSKPEQKN